MVSWNINSSILLWGFLIETKKVTLHATYYTGTVKVWDEGIEKNLQRKLMNAPCLQSKDVNWIKVRPNFHRRNLSFCLGLHNCRPFCCTFFQYNLQRVSPSNALPWTYTIHDTLRKSLVNKQQESCQALIIFTCELQKLSVIDKFLADHWQNFLACMRMVRKSAHVRTQA